MRTARPLLRQVLRAVRRDVAVCVVAGLAWQAVAIAVPWVLERAVDDGIVPGDRDVLWRWAGVLAALGVVRYLGDAARHWWVERAGARAASWLRRRLVARLVALDDDEAARFGHGDLAARAIGDADTIWLWVAGIATLATAGSTFVAVAVLLVTLHPVLALVGFAAVPLAALLAARQVGVHGRAAADAAAGAGGYAGVVESAVAGARTIKGLGAEEVVLARAATASRALAERMLGLASVEARWVAAAAAIPAAAITAGLWLGGSLVIDGTISVGALVAFAGWMGLLVDATETLTERLVTRGEAGAAAERLAELIGDGQGLVPSPPLSSPAAAVLAEAGPGADVAVDGVVARRGGRDVLRDVDLDVPAGAWLAVAGPTGGGKTTLLRLIAGLDQAVVGTVRIGGARTGEGDRTWLRRTVTYLPQGAAPVSGPLEGFLRLARPGASDDELRAALAAAGAEDVVEGLGGLDGVVGDRGMSLSGGQRQRVALAAAVLRRPRLLCLDDATSALDPSIELLVIDRLRRVLPGTTVVIATHRSATAAACDRAVIVADGGLVPSTPEALASSLHGRVSPAPAAGEELSR